MKSKIAKRCSRTAPKFTWIGGLKELRDEYTSVQLQEKASDWMVESALGKLAKNRKEPGEVLK